MSEREIFEFVLVVWLLLAPVFFIVLFFINAPYGRYLSRRTGPVLNNRLGWVIMEMASPLVFLLCFYWGRYNLSLTAWIFLLMWQAHYLHRAFIYPFRLPLAGAGMPLFIIALGMIFNLVNAYLNGRYLFHFSGGYEVSWLLDIRFLAGLGLFAVGFIINRQADIQLNRVRAESNGNYTVLNAGLYRWVSCPNYLGEIIIWVGWAVATWSLAGLAFAVWTVANLAPRARAHHRWYLERFDDYPAERKALLPGIW